MSTDMTGTIYTRHHVWLLPGEDDEYTLGITQFAQEQLGDIVFVDLPAVGGLTKQGEACLVVESVKSASDVICPIQGEIIQINEALADEPELINESPYDQGWIIRIKVKQGSVIQDKMTVDEYNNYILESAE